MDHNFAVLWSIVIVTVRGQFVIPNGFGVLSNEWISFVRNGAVFYIWIRHCFRLSE